MNHTDILKTHWIYRLIPSSLHPYFLIMRIDRPIGVWLLFLPCLWGLSLTKSPSPPLKEAAFFLVGAFLMRSAGCIYNDMIDRKIDRHVERTARRPLASGVLSLCQASWALLGLLSLSFLILLRFNFTTVLTGSASLFLIALYPWMKRVTYWPQLFLGFAFNWGTLLGWTALQETFSLEPLILYLGGLFWTLGYDTFYAFQDLEDDLRIGVKSTAIRFQETPKFFLTGAYGGLHGCLILLGFLKEASFFYFAALAFLAVPLYGQILLFRPADRKQALALFRFNRWIGFMILGCLLLL